MQLMCKMHFPAATPCCPFFGNEITSGGESWATQVDVHLDAWFV
jgi:hypothetical protein